MAKTTKPMTVAQVFDGLNKLFQDADVWIKRRFATASRTSRKEISTTSPQAVCFCLDGALQHVCGGGTNKLYHEARSVLSRAVGQIDSEYEGLVIDFNDVKSRTIDEIRAAVLVARNMARTEEAAA